MRKCRIPNRSRSALEAQAESLSAGWITPREVLQRLRIVEALVYKLLHAGEIPAVRIGHLWRIPRTAREDYLEVSVLGRRLETRTEKGPVPTTDPAPKVPLTADKEERLNANT